MDTFQCIRTRRTTRAFLPTEVPQQTIRNIMEAGRLTPSARNLQPWHFVAIQDRGMLKQLERLVYQWALHRTGELCRRRGY